MIEIGSPTGHKTSGKRGSREKPCLLLRNVSAPRSCALGGVCTPGRSVSLQLGRAASGADGRERGSLNFSSLSFPSGCLWVAAALPLLLGARASPILDSSGEEQLSEDPSPRTWPVRDFQLANCKLLAIALRRKAVSWKTELCKEQTLCKNNTEIIPQNNLRFPKITTEDECPPHGSNKERCLRGLSSGLYAYQAFLEYIENTFISKEQETAFIWQSTKHLANTLKSMMNAPDTVTMPDPITKEALSTQLGMQTGWNRKVVHYLILQDYISFMEKTVRAIRVL
ncbi:interleukin-6 [Eublepharis macularius]|uniref:Interleukin-6 n=1 Tax=Eublepharis macularius TaxID=481883 RepID=A0AA97K0M9_EUBMA|nr:interleukin-6 [Eublepharis macularius]